jgi:hypothetical protein
MVQLVEGIAGYLKSPCVERLVEVEARMACHLVSAQSTCALDVVEGVKRSPERFKRRGPRLANVKFVGLLDHGDDEDDEEGDDDFG